MHSIKIHLFGNVAQLLYLNSETFRRINLCPPSLILSPISPRLNAALPVPAALVEVFQRAQDHVKGSFVQDQRLPLHGPMNSSNRAK